MKKSWKNGILAIAFLVSIVLFFAWKDNANRVLEELELDVMQTVHKVEVGVDKLEGVLWDDTIIDSFGRAGNSMEVHMKGSLDEISALESVAIEESVAKEKEEKKIAQQIAESEEIEETIEEEVPMFTTVTEDYFEDACFIGDSRTVGLYSYANLPADFFCASGMTVYKIFKDPDGRFTDGNWTQNIELSLQQKQYGKVYIMVGINEVGTGDTQYFKDHFEEVINRIRELQPTAIIYIEANTLVTAKRSSKGDSINNEELARRNLAISELANDKDIFYIDMNEVVCDETGALNPEYTFDGVHLYANCVDRWVTFLEEHAVVPTQAPSHREN